ncbi:MAG: signal peptidase I [Clostridia bacterium]|nr:signal peptidase I [Clostridia bacterium]
MINKVKKIFGIIVLVILLVVLFVNSVILIDSVIFPDSVPSFFGWKPFIVLSGSMETEIYSGDLAIVKEVDASKIKENDVIAFKSGNIVVTHRVIEIVNEGGVTKYKTKGDNNNIEDEGYVLAEQIEGLYQFKVSRMGNLAMFTQTPIGMIVCLSIPLGLLVIIQMTDSKDNKKYQKESANKEKELQEEIEKLRKQNEELKKK